MFFLFPIVALFLQSTHPVPQLHPQSTNPPSKAMKNLLGSLRDRLNKNSGKQNTQPQNSPSLSAIPIETLHARKSIFMTPTVEPLSDGESTESSSPNSSVTICNENELYEDNLDESSHLGTSPITGGKLRFFDETSPLSVEYYHFYYISNSEDGHEILILAMPRYEIQNFKFEELKSQTQVTIANYTLIIYKLALTNEEYARFFNLFNLEEEKIKTVFNSEKAEAAKSFFSSKLKNSIKRAEIFPLKFTLKKDDATEILTNSKLKRAIKTVRFSKGRKLEVVLRLDLMLGTKDKYKVEWEIRREREKAIESYEKGAEVFIPGTLGIAEILKSNSTSF